jgi:ParB/RepB/Spo0J family partition protein
MSAVQFPRPGEKGLQALRTAVSDGQLLCSSTGETLAATKLNAHRYLDRDKRNGNLWFPTEHGRAALQHFDGIAVPKPVEPGARGIVTVGIDNIDIGFRLRDVDQAKVDAIKASIGEIGLRTPITVRPLPNGKFGLVAGAHRLTAVQQTGGLSIECIVSDSDDVDAELWEIDENLCRADLSPTDKAIFTHRRKDLYLQKHPETAHGVNQHSRSRQVGDSSEPEPKRFTTATAEATGQSERAVQRDAERGERISEQALRRIRGTGLDTGVTLDKLKRLSPEQQMVFVEAALDERKRKLAEAKEIRTAQHAIKRTVRTGLIAGIAARGTHVAGQMPRAAYPVLYADPPWQQEAWSDDTGQDKGLMYPAMPLDDIKALCAGDKSPATPDAKLYLWVPTNRLDDGIDVLHAWGFDYTSAIVWDKVHIGMGREVRDRSEILLIGKRGAFPGLTLGTQTESLYAEVKTGHSRKPVWFAEQIERLYPDLPKLELFQRKQSLAPGDIRLTGNWNFWGFEASTDQGEAA